MQRNNTLGADGSNVRVSGAAALVPAQPRAPSDSTASSSSTTAINTGSSSATNPAGKVRYIPPHMRSRQQQQQQHQQVTSLSDESDISDTSDISDAEGGVSRPSSGNSSSSRSSRDPFKASRVRTAALLLVQAMAQADPAALQPYWQSILPSQSVVEGLGAGSANLLTCALFDPVPRVCVGFLLFSMSLT
jgi:hypothetical protein